MSGISMNEHEIVGRLFRATCEVWNFSRSSIQAFLIQKDELLLVLGVECAETAAVPWRRSVRVLHNGIEKSVLFTQFKLWIRDKELEVVHD